VNFTLLFCPSSEAPLPFKIIPEIDIRHPLMVMSHHNTKTDILISHSFHSLTLGLCAAVEEKINSANLAASQVAKYPNDSRYNNHCHQILSHSHLGRIIRKHSLRGYRLGVGWQKLIQIYLDRWNYLCILGSGIR